MLMWNLMPAIWVEGQVAALARTGCNGPIRVELVAEVLVL